jgi:hypothetical protein
LCIRERSVAMPKNVLAGISATSADPIVKLLSFDEKTIFFIYLICFLILFLLFRFCFFIFCLRRLVHYSYH